MTLARGDLAIAVPQAFPDGRVDPAFLHRYLARAEALGFQSAWVVEQTLGGMATLGPIELLTWAAAGTTRLRLGTAVLLTALHSPLHLAKSLASLDQLSGGRLDVGVGLGADRAAYPAHGIPAERRAARFAEGIQLMRRLWTEPRVTFAGEFYQVKDVVMGLRPVQRPHPPLWFGGHAEGALRRAVELGQGFVGGGAASTAAFAGQVGTIRRLLGESGRDPAAWPFGKRVYIAVDDDRARAGRRLTAWCSAFYGRPQLAEEVSVWGPPEACAEGLRRVFEAGARFVILNPVFDEMEQLERIASSVAPRL